jgi:hypothetical protein
MPGNRNSLVIIAVNSREALQNEFLRVQMDKNILKSFLESFPFLTPNHTVAKEYK